MGKDKCETCGSPVRVEGHTTQYYVTAYDDLRRDLSQIRQAVDAQAEDGTLWVHSKDCTIGEAYVTQSLRWLHQVIETGDTEALAKIIAQSKDEI